MDADEQPALSLLQRRTALDARQDAAPSSSLMVNAPIVSRTAAPTQPAAKQEVSTSSHGPKAHDEPMRRPHPWSDGSCARHDQQIPKRTCCTDPDPGEAAGAVARPRHDGVCLVALWHASVAVSC